MSSKTEWDFFSGLSDLQNPANSLFFEESLLKKSFEKPSLLIYENSKAIVLGRNQNLWEEVNYDYCLSQSIPVLRRITGGGTVFHGKGNLIISFIEKSESRTLIPMKKYNSIIKSSLKELGYEIQEDSRNALFWNEKKVSGNAQTLKNGITLSHATLLVKAELKNLKPAIEPSVKGIKSRSISSVRSVVVNLCETDSQYKTFKKDFSKVLSEKIGIGSYPKPIPSFSQKELSGIEERLFSLNPDFEYQWHEGQSKMKLRVEKGRIAWAKKEGEKSVNIKDQDFNTWLRQKD